MKIIPLDPVGVEIVDIDIEHVTDEQCRAVRDTFVEHQLVLIRNQRSENPLFYARLIERISSRGITDLSRCNGFVDRFVGTVLHRGMKPGIHQEMWPPDGVPKQPSTWDVTVPFPVQRVTGERYQGIYPGVFPTGSLLWHSDRMSLNHVNSTSLMARNPNNTSTSFIHTAAAYRDLPEDVKQICADVTGDYKFNVDLLAPEDPDPHSVNKHVLVKSQIKQNGSLDFSFPLIVENASKSTKGLYFNFNVLQRLRGCSDDLVTYLKQHLTKPCYYYRHWWQRGDIMLFSQDLTLHCREEVTNTQLENRLLFRYGFHIDPVA